MRGAGDAQRELRLPDAAGTGWRLDERRRSQVPQEPDRIDQSGERVHPQGRVVLVVRVQLRVEVIPVLQEQLADQLQRTRQPRQALQHRLRPGKEDGDPEVPGALHERQRLGLDLAPVGFLCGHQRVPELLLRLAAGRDLEVRERRVIVEAVATRRLLGKTQRH